MRRESVATLLCMSTSLSPLSPTICVEELLPAGRHYLLPRRDLGKARWLALPLAGVGFVFSAAVLFWTIDALGIRQKPPDLMNMIFAALGVPGILIGLLPLVMALAMLFGHSEIEVRGGRLRTIERLGPLRWSRIRSQTVVKKLVVETGRPQSEQQRNPAASLMGELAAIRIHWDGSKPWLAAIGYPRELLIPLAHDLAAQCRLPAEVPLGAPQAPPVPIEVVDRAVVSSTETHFERPHESQIVVTEEDGSMTFNIPSRGLRHGSHGLFAFACIWCGFMVVFTFAGVVGGMLDQGLKHALVWLGFIAVFWVVGIGMMLAAINMGRRRAGIVVADGRLSVFQTGLFGSKERSWTKDEISTVRLGNSGMEVNDVPVPELQILPIGEKKVGLLAGRDPAELNWLAAVICRALDVPHFIDNGRFIVHDVEEQPAKSRVQCAVVLDGLTFSIPRPGLLPTMGIWAFALFWNIFLAGMTAAFGFAGALQESLFAAFLLGIFWCVGVGIIGVAVHMTIHRAEIAVAGDRLLVIRTGLFGTKRNEWARDELAAIRAGASGSKLNNDSFMQLQIVPKTDKQVALLTGRDERELAWLATLLRRALALPAEVTLSDSHGQKPVAIGPH